MEQRLPRLTTSPGGHRPPARHFVLKSGWVDRRNIQRTFWKKNVHFYSQLLQQKRWIDINNKNQWRILFPVSSYWSSINGSTKFGESAIAKVLFTFFNPNTRITILLVIFGHLFAKYHTLKYFPPIAMRRYLSDDGSLTCIVPLTMIWLAVSDLVIKRLSLRKFWYKTNKLFIQSWPLTRNRTTSVTVSKDRIIVWCWCYQPQNTL